MYDLTDYPKEERRKYTRLDSAYPVQFKFINAETKADLSGWMQGFTNDIGKGGICLKVNKPSPEFIQLLKEGKAHIGLELDMPITRKPIPARAAISWFRFIEGDGEKCLIGLKFSEIDTGDNNKILRFARAKKIFTPLVVAVIALLVFAFAVDSYINIKLIRGNKALVEQLVKVLQDSSIAKQKIKEIDRQKEDLNIKIEALGVRIKSLEQEKQSAQAQASKSAELNSRIEKLLQDKAGLQEQMISVQTKEAAVTEELVRLDKRKVVLEKANLDKMYRWLVVHQNPRTGLVVSFEGDSDIAGWAFTYDQALVTQSYSIFSDFSRARKILEFYSHRAKRVNGLFLDAYYVSDGSPAEYIIHCGPNLWLGIAALQYAKKSQDSSYVELARDIARGIMNLQSQDADGGLRGGPEVEWYSTEHNLDAYAFFNMLYEVTGDQQYKDSAAKVLGWLVKYAYGRPELPVKRGKGDSTIATDTYAWSIAAVGPKKLEELGMNPDKIIEFAESTCAVEVSYTRPEGKTFKLKGFDFAPQQHLARGGVISTEWTSQMIISFKIMSAFYYAKNKVAKAKEYEQKADDYLAQLSNLVISSPSPTGQGEGCLPYATEEMVDTGHGWMTPKGKTTGSIAGTAYTLFAYYNYNPLEMKD
ncbi:MAG: PilZ domain-containing protein [Candidatus Omnitrophica bacterium]|nr:PilZ domain-containing protein [Candidatus Omnitrophota bacterium]